MSESAPAGTPADGPQCGPYQGAFDRRSTLIPLRRLPLAPTRENVWPQVARRLNASFPKWAAFWADGERSLAEIAAMISLEEPARRELPQVIEYFEVLAELGYVELVNPADFATEEQLAADFVALGIQAGMDVMVHSSMKSIGPVRGGSAAVVRALLRAVGPGGTLLAPSFNHFRAAVFNPLTTPTANGAIADAVWRRPDALRSGHPSHSVAAIGPRAGEYVCDHLANGIWAANSPIGRLIEAGGHILSIGVGHDRSTAYHIAEIALGVPCLDQFGSVDRIVGDDGKVQSVRGLAWRAEECPVSPGAIDTMLSGKQSRGCVGRAAATLALARDIVEARRQQLGDRCGQCPIRPERRNASSASAASGPLSPVLGGRGLG